ncbi:unnamed protein product, partial [Durusdinium trenchii]
MSGKTLTPPEEAHCDLRVCTGDAMVDDETPATFAAVGLGDHQTQAASSARLCLPQVKSGYQESSSALTDAVNNDAELERICEMLNSELGIMKRFKLMMERNNRQAL